MDEDTRYAIKQQQHSSTIAIEYIDQIIEIFAGSHVVTVDQNYATASVVRID
jgi:hypothetical protein